MSEEIKEVEQIEQDDKASELSDEDLENAAGGAAKWSASGSTCSGAACPQPIPGKIW